MFCRVFRHVLNREVLQSCMSVSLLWCLLQSRAKSRSVTVLLTWADLKSCTNKKCNKLMNTQIEKCSSVISWSQRIIFYTLCLPSQAEGGWVPRNSWPFQISHTRGETGRCAQLGLRCNGCAAWSFHTENFVLDVKRVIGLDGHVEYCKRFRSSAYKQPWERGILAHEPLPCILPWIPKGPFPLHGQL